MNIRDIYQQVLNSTITINNYKTTFARDEKYLGTHITGSDAMRELATNAELYEKIYQLIVQILFAEYYKDKPTVPKLSIKYELLITKTLSYARIIAAQLVILYGNEDVILRYLEVLQNRKTKDDLVFADKLKNLDFSLSHPWSLKLWRALAISNFGDGLFERVMVHAGEVEKYVAKNYEQLKSKIAMRVKQTYLAEIKKNWESMQIDNELGLTHYVTQRLKKSKKYRREEVEIACREKIVKELNLPHGKLDKDQVDLLKNHSQNATVQLQRKEFEAALEKKYQAEYEKDFQTIQSEIFLGQETYIQKQLEQNAGRIKTYCNNAYQSILSHSTDLQTLTDYAGQVHYHDAADNPEAAKLFFRVKESRMGFYKYLSLKPIDSDVIPNVTINGAEIGHPGYSLERLSSFDPRAALLGKDTGCCLHIDHDAGISSVIFGITHPDAGFYILRHNNKIVGQCLAWRGLNGEMVFDSVETEPSDLNDSILCQKKKTLIMNHFIALAHLLVTKHDVPAVYMGTKSGSGVALKLIKPVLKPIKCDGFNSSDAREQILLAESISSIQPYLKHYPNNDLEAFVTKHSQGKNSLRLEHRVEPKLKTQASEKVINSAPAMVNTSVRLNRFFENLSPKAMSVGLALRKKMIPTNSLVNRSDIVTPVQHHTWRTHHCLFEPKRSFNTVSVGRFMGKMLKVFR